MITPGEFLASLVLVGLGGLWLGHFVGKRAGWCEGYNDAIGDSWDEYDEIEASVDHYGESEN